MNSTTSTSLLVLGLIAELTSCATRQTRPTTPEPGTAADQSEASPNPDLPFEAREMIAERMLRHGDQMTALLATVVLLGYEASSELSNEIVGELRLARPTAEESGTLNAALPPAFFTYQDQLVERARTVADAAERRDDEELGRSFGALAETCIGCHSAFFDADLRSYYREQFDDYLNGEIEDENRDFEDEFEQYGDEL